MTVRVAESAPGEVAEVDFGRLGLVPDSERGGNRVMHALIVTLVHSRRQYVQITHSQKLADLIGGIEDAFAFFAGFPDGSSSRSRNGPPGEIAARLGLHEQHVGQLRKRLK